MPTNPRTPESLDPNTTQPRQCDKCGETKPLGEFYFKKDRNDFDKTCSTCRKSRRNSRHRISVKSSDRIELADDLPISSTPDDAEQIACRAINSELSDEEFGTLVRTFQLLKQWYDEALSRGPIPGWQSIES